MGTCIDVDVEKPSDTHITIERGTLYMEHSTLQGVDVLKGFGAPGRLALRSSIRRDDFRYVYYPALRPPGSQC